MSLEVTVKLPLSVVAAIQAAANAQAAKHDTAVTNSILDAAVDSIRQLPCRIQLDQDEDPTTQARGTVTRPAHETANTTHNAAGNRVRFSEEVMRDILSVPDPGMNPSARARLNSGQFIVRITRAAGASQGLSPSYNYKVQGDVRGNELKERISAQSGISTSQLRLWRGAPHPGQMRDACPVAADADSQTRVLKLTVDSGHVADDIQNAESMESTRSSQPGPNPKLFSIFVKVPNMSTTMTLLVNKDMTVSELQKNISRLTNMPVCSSRLHFGGRILRDGYSTLDEYDVEKEATITIHIAGCEHSGTPGAVCEVHGRSFGRGPLEEYRDNLKGIYWN